MIVRNPAHNGFLTLVEIKKYYAGIGSRKTPDNMLRIIRRVAIYLYNKEYTLRSGKAIGADSAFESAALVEFYKVARSVPDSIINPLESYTAVNATSFSRNYVAQFVNGYSSRKKYVQDLLARNANIILGANLDSPVDFVVCWTPRAKDVGGTGVSIRIAEANNIPVFNLANPEHLERICNKIGVLVI